MNPDFKALFDKVVKGKADLPAPKARDYTRKVKVTFTMTMHLIKLCIENPSSMDDTKGTHRGDGAAYWERLKDQAVRRALVGEDGDVTRIRHLFPVTKHGRRKYTQSASLTASSRDLLYDGWISIRSSGLASLGILH
jgi:hypothetical protein